MVTLISPYRKARDAARKKTEAKGIPFLEIFLDVPLEVVKARDPKGLYAKVAKGLIKGFTGIDAPYEAPLKPEITLKTAQLSIDQMVEMQIAELQKRGLLTGYVSPPASSPPTAATSSASWSTRPTCP